MLNPYDEENQILIAALRRATIVLSLCRPGKGQTESDLADAISLTVLAYKTLTGKDIA